MEYIRTGYLATLLLLYSSLLFSQSYTFSDSYKDGDNGGRLTVNQDERLNELVRRHISINKQEEGIQGYRIRIFSESGQLARPNATNVRAKFFNKYPDIETYLVYDAPNFKVYVGDFRTRSEALKIQKIINQDYPYSFIISDRINFPPLD
jgi:hypothetical protein